MVRRTLVAIVLCVGVGCGGGKDSAEDGQAGGAQGACEDLCDASAQGDGCDTEAVKTECYDLCILVTLGIGDCEDEYIASAQCEAQQDWVCDGSFEINGVDFPWALSTECATEAEALYQCTEGL